MSTQLSALGTPEYWRERAEEARVLAERMTDPGTRRIMLGIAEDCDKIAQRAEARVGINAPMSKRA